MGWLRGWGRWIQRADACRHAARMLETRLLVVGLVQMRGWSEELVTEAALGTRQNTHALGIFFFQETLRHQKLQKYFLISIWAGLKTILL